MNFVAISDVHIISKGDEAYRLFLKFLRHEDTFNANSIFLLGDIFDLMSGYHHEYLQEFEEIFQLYSEHTKRGATIHYLEGNHDLHLSRLFQKASKEFHIPPGRLNAHANDFLLNDQGLRIFLSHGDELQMTFKYRAYKSFIKSKPLAVLANYLVPFKMLEYFGRKASSTSRELNHLKFSEPQERERIKEKHRHLAKVIIEKYQADYFLCGHCHEKDLVQLDRGTYANNGFALHSKTFISYKDHQLGFTML